MKQTIKLNPIMNAVDSSTLATAVATAVAEGANGMLSS